MTEHSCYYAIYGNLILEVPHYLKQAIMATDRWIWSNGNPEHVSTIVKRVIKQLEDLYNENDV